MIIAAALVLVTGARADPLPQPKPSGPGGSCPLGYFTSGWYCVPSQGAQDAAEIGERHVPIWVDEERQLLPSQRSMTSARDPCGAT